MAKTSRTGSPVAVFGTASPGASPRVDIRGNVLVTAAAQEPVSAQEVQDLLGLPDDMDTAILVDITETAREEVERFAGIACLPQEWRVSLDLWPWDRQWLTLPVWPLRSISSASVYGLDGTATAIAVGTFDVDTTSQPGRIRVRSGANMPTTARDFDAFHIVYSAGYESGILVPLWLRRAVKVTACHMYTHRGDGCDAAEALKGSGAMASILRHIPAHRGWR